MQIPARGKFEENPGWALRPDAPGRVYANPPAHGNSQHPRGRRTAWAGNNPKRLRRFLSGLIPPRHATSYIDYTDPAKDFELFRQYTAFYLPAAQQYVQDVLREIGNLGFTIENLVVACDPGTGCFPPMYSGVLAKNGRIMEASFGNPVRYNSAWEEASAIAQLFEQSSIAVSPPTTAQYPSTQTAVQYPSTQTAVQYPSTQTAVQYPPTQTYTKTVQMSAPDGYMTGKRFTLKIWGKPNSTVQISAVQNGQSHGMTTFGTTSSSGYYEISSVWEDSHEGVWYEEIYVGGELVGTLHFALTRQQNQHQQPGVVTVSPSASSVLAQETTDNGNQTLAQETTDTGNQTLGEAPAAKPGMILWIGIGAAALLLLSGKR